MKRNGFMLVVLAAILALSTLLTACGAKETVTTVNTREEVRDMVNAFYEGLLTADPISMTTTHGEGEPSVFIRDGDKMYSGDGVNYDYYMFMEDGKKFFMGDGETAYEDEYMYDMSADTLNNLLMMYVTGVLDADMEDDSFTYQATRTDKTEGGKALSELVYTLTGENEGQAITLTVTGKAADGQVSGIEYDAQSGEDAYHISLQFAYDGVSVELPEYTVYEEYVVEGVHVESPYQTIQELIDTLDEEEPLFYITTEDALVAVGEKDGRYYQFTAPFPREEMDAFDALEFDDDYWQKAYAILGKLVIEDCIDFTDVPLSQSELDAYVGKSVEDMVDDGFESSGWFIGEEGDATLYFSKDLMAYEAQATLPDGFDVESEFEYEDLYGATINGIRFSEPEYAALPIQ